MEVSSADDEHGDHLLISPFCFQAMIGSYGPARDPYQKIVSQLTPLDPTAQLIQVCSTQPQFAAEESPSGMLARSGSYDVRSRIIDDDNKTWLDFEWSGSPLSKLRA
jgi:Rho GDP-dissociation inhibitor